MTEFQQVPIAYGVKLVFSDGTAVNWYRDSRRKTVFAEKNPAGHVFPRSAEKLEQILAVLEGGAPEVTRDDAGRGIGAFDGGADPNPGIGGWGVVLPDGGELSGTEPHTTNNRMELTALIEAYKALPPDAETTIFSDSEICVKTINEWAAGWEARGWRRKTGPIKNLELVQELYRLARAHPRVTLRWIRAHDGSRWNEYVDALANAYMLRGGGVR